MLDLLERLATAEYLMTAMTNLQIVADAVPLEALIAVHLSQTLRWVLGEP